MQRLGGSTTAGVIALNVVHQAGTAHDLCGVHVLFGGRSLKHEELQQQSESGIARIAQPSSLLVLTHGVKGGACLEPLNLVLIEGLVDWELVGLAIGLLANHSQRLAGLEVGQALDADLVKGSYLLPHTCILNIIAYAPPISRARK